MAQIPKRVKYRKSQRGNRGGNASRGVDVSFGDFGLQALDRGWMSSRQIEACRVGPGVEVGFENFFNRVLIQGAQVGNARSCGPRLRQLMRELGSELSDRLKIRTL